MKIRWRLKTRWLRDFSSSFLKSLYRDPGGTIRLLLAMPFLWLEHRSEYEYVESDSQADDVVLARDVALVREVKLLFDSLPLELRDLGIYLNHPQYSEKEVEEMFSYEETQKVYGAGLPYTRALLRYGLTPFHFFEAVQGIEGFLRRLRRRGFWDGAFLHIDTTTGRIQEVFESDGKIFRFDEMIVEEIALMTEQSQQANGLWQLVFALLRYRPYLIEGYEAQVDGDMTILKPSSVLEQISAGDTLELWFERLQKRWRKPRL